MRYPIRSFPQPPRAASGFTLLELIVTLAVAAILVTVAIPGFATFITNQHVKTASQELFSDLLYARSEAIKRNGQVTVTKAGSWADGWTITDAGGTTLRKHQALDQIKLGDGNGGTPAVDSVTYDRTGRLVGGGTPTFGFCGSDSASGVTKRLVTIDLSGRATLNRGGGC